MASPLFYFSQSDHKPQNVRDYLYRMQLETTQSFLTTQSTVLKNSTLISKKPFVQSGEFSQFYRSVLGPVLYSECKNLPSDSRYLQLYKEQNQCKRNSIIMHSLYSIHRVLREHDLHLLGTPVIYKKNLHWIDIYPRNCHEESAGW